MRITEKTSRHTNLIASGIPTGAIKNKVARNPGSRILLVAALGLCGLFSPGCGRHIGEQVKDAIPFLPKSKFVDVGGRKLTHEEVAYYQKIKDHSVAVKVHPNDPVAYNSLGRLFQIKGNFDLAKQLYQKAAELDPTQSEAFHNLGVIATRESRYAEAIGHLRKAVRLSPDDALIWQRLGKAYFGIGQLRNAWQSFEKALELDDEFTPAYLDQAKLLYSQRRYREAEARCRASLAHLPPPPPPEQAKSKKDGGILGKVLPDFSEDDKPKEFTAEFETRYDLALCLKAQGRLRDALEVLVPCELCVSGKADIQILKSKLQEGLGNKAGAIVTLEALREDFPDMAEIAKRLARLHQASGQTEKAIEKQLEAAELDYSDRALQMRAAHSAEAAGDQAQAIAIHERLVRSNPEDIPTWRRLAKAYDEAGIKHQAAFAYQEIANRDPLDLKVRRRLGMLYADLPGYQGRALLQFKRILKTQPTDVEVLRKLGELYLAARQLEKAEDYLEKALRHDPRHAETQLTQARLFMLQNRGADAVAAYRKALALDSSLNEANLELARALIRIDRNENAIPLIEKYLVKKPKDIKARRLLADQLRDLNRRELAVQEYGKIAALDPSDTSTVMELARLSTVLGKRIEAAGMYEALLDRHPSHTEALRASARLYGKLDEPLREMYCWQRLLKLRPKDLDAREHLAASYKAIGSDDEAIDMYLGLGHAEAWRNIAFLRLRREGALRVEGRPEAADLERKKALDAYRKVIQAEPQDLSARLTLASILQKSKDREVREEASQLYREVIKIDPKNIRARLNLGNLYSRNNRLAQAQDEYDLILREQPGHVGALLGSGIVFRKLGKYKKALKQYLLALEKNPNSSKIHYNTAVLYDYYLDQPADAKQHYQSYTSLGGDPKLIPGPESEQASTQKTGRPASTKRAPKTKPEKEADPSLPSKAGVVTIQDAKETEELKPIPAQPVGD